ncbi:MAG: hypothetical protein HOW73_37735 [Polyangiaceae bacterium]|nr:hypothetical protein [Polyangiaceae bacterium]
MAALNPYVVSFLKGVNRDYPGRKKASDGTWGDLAHQKRKSDHNTGDAVDITHDPAHGADGDTIAARALADPNVKYVIWNHRIYNKARPGWRPYHGSNPHTKHVHVSFKRGNKRVAQGDPRPARVRKKKRRTPKRRPKRTVSGRPIPKRRSAGGKTSKKKSGGKRIVKGHASVVLGKNQLMIAHVETPHTGGGKIAKGSPDVFVGKRILAVARIGDPTTDKLKVKSGLDSVAIG